MISVNSLSGLFGNISMEYCDHLHVKCGLDLDPQTITIPQHWNLLPLGHLPLCCTGSGRIKTTVWLRSGSRVVEMPSSSLLAACGPPDGSSELWKMRWQKTSQTASSGRQDKEQRACRVYSSLHLITGSNCKWAICSFWSWHLRSFKQDVTQIKMLLKLLWKFKILIHSRLQAALSDLGQLPHGSSKWACRSCFMHTDAVARGQIKSLPLFDIHNGWSATVSTVIHRKCPSPSSNTRGQ